jgi:hypothetical protein
MTINADYFIERRRALRMYRMTFMLYDKPSVLLSESDQAWYNLIKTEFTIYMRENEGPYNLPDFFNNILCITHHKYKHQSEQTTLWNAKDHIMRDFCSIEVDIPRFQIQFFNGKYYDMRIFQILHGIDDNKDYVFGIETTNGGDYKLYLSNIKVATLLRISHGFNITTHGAC